MKLLKNALPALLVTLVCGSAFAADRPLLDNDRVAVFLHSVSSAEAGNENVRVRAAICVAFNKCKEFTITPVIAVRKGESIDFDKKDVKARRSQVFTGDDLNDRIEELAKEKNVRDVKPQIAIMLVRVDAAGKVIEKSDSAYLDFPGLKAEGEAGVLKNTANLRLRTLQAKVSVAIERK